MSELPLAGVRVIELASFVAGPSCGLTLAQLGADVIRIDPIGGGPDIGRWPLDADGRSIYWAGLNRGKRSVVLDLGSEEGRQTVHRLVSHPTTGILVTNLAGKGWLSDQALRVGRSDLVNVQVLGRLDGSPAVDYTVNALFGLPFASGPVGDEPVNNTLPAWDLLCGAQAAIAVLTAVRHRERTGAGTHLTIGLDDIALAALTTLGYLPEAQLTGTDRPAVGNEIYGTFGAELRLADGQRVMVVALTPRQWTALVEATDTGKAVAAVEDALGADFADEGQRWVHRDVLTGLLKPWFRSRTLPEVAAALDERGVLWSPYRHFTDTVRDLLDGRLAGTSIRPAADGMLATSGAIRIAGTDRTPGAAPRLGEHTDAVLAELL